jgi:thiamine-monophosphate kinase
MGARPIGFTFALAAPPRLDARIALELVRGTLVEAKRHGAPLVGGNLTRAREVSLTIAAFGGVKAARALRRSGARAGDRIFVTGTLGRAALDRLRAERTRGGRRRAVAAPRLAAGAALARLPGIGGCIDVSDGLAADLVHVLDASGVGGEVRVDALPRPAGFAAACARLRLDPHRLLLAGGEDYELLFTGRGRGAQAGLLARRLGVRVTEIGRITASAGRLRLLGRGLRRGAATAGWTHF